MGLDIDGISGGDEEQVIVESHIPFSLKECFRWVLVKEITINFVNVVRAGAGKRKMSNQ